ncbi:MAG: CapA family protein [Planctomycetia bacterium]|nr:CapA family protein [Planctomycetia bacterium]
MHRGLRILIALLTASVLLAQAACHKKSSGGGGSGSGGSSSSGGGSPSPEPPPEPVDEDPSEFSVAIRVVDESGLPIVGATVTWEGGAPVTPADGTVVLAGLQGPIAVVASATGFLTEPAIFDRPEAGAVQDVRLWAAISPTGQRRVSMHLAGDCMLGRRYVAPVDDDTPVVVPGDGGTSARAVVSAIAPIFRAADLQSVNVESVIGPLPASAAYPKKLFTIQSVTEITALLDELGIDVAVLANNHIRDWQEPGISSTLSALDAAGIPRTGAGLTEAEAAAPATYDVNGLEIGFLCYSTMSGDTVNDEFPLDADPEPSPLDPGQAWKYEFRSWGYSGPIVTIPAASRRIGSAWVEIDAWDSSSLDPAERAALWSSAIAVYPELQDWVARRGHGGANYFLPSRVAVDVPALRAAGADLVVVQIHSGYNTYDDFASMFASDSARAAIDAGADLVVGHHPHVLNGLEFYNGKLIVSSLGNFVFDQDFLPTFTSAFLRAVFEESTVLDFRLVPLTIHRYRPIPVAGPASRDVMRFLHERSLVDARLFRLSGQVAAVLTPLPAGSEHPELVLDRHLVRIQPGPGSTSAFPLDLEAGELALLTDAPLTRSRASGGAPLPPLQFGRDIFRWGHFDDAAADGASKGGFFWYTPAADFDHKRILAPGDAPSPFHSLFLRRLSSNISRTRVRPVARIVTTANRLFTDAGGLAIPADGTASWSVLLRARRSGEGTTTLILDVHHFDTSVPNEEPDAAFLRTVELTWSVPSDGEWHDVVVDIPASTWDPVGSDEANQALLYVALYPVGDDCDLWVDDLMFVEWRDAGALPDFPFSVDAIRSPTGSAASATLERRDR